MAGVLEIPRFGGLDLRNDSQEIGAAAAIDMLNVDADKLLGGKCATRWGLSQADVSGGSGSYFIAYPVAGSLYLFRWSGSSVNLDKMSTAGAITGVGFGSGAGTVFMTPNSVASLGTPTTATTFFVIRDGAGTGVTLRKTDGSTVSSSVGKPAFVAVTPWDDRLVQAGFIAAADSPTGANGSLSTVFFSDAGAPETFAADNFVHLRPGDEVITGMVAWRNLLMVFKSSHLFTFWGTSTDGDGEPVFDYDHVTLPSRTISWPVVGTDGVYFMTDDGVYRTTGRDAVKVSEAIDGIFNQNASTSLAMNLSSQALLHWADEKLFVSYTTQAATSRVLVFDPRSGIWALWGFPAYPASIVEWPASTWAFPTGKAQVYVAQSNSHIYRLSSSATDDYGTAISSSYQTGFFDGGSGASEKLVREWLLDGSGTVTIKTAVNDGSLGTGQSVTLGTAPAIARGRDRRSVRGRNFSLQFSATSGAWSVSRAFGNVTGQRAVGLSSSS